MKSCVFLGTYQIFGEVSHSQFKFSFQNVALSKVSKFSASISHVCKRGMFLCHSFLFSPSSSQRAANECLPSALKILITVIPRLSVRDCGAPGNLADGEIWSKWSQSCHCGYHLSFSEGSIKPLGLNYSNQF